MSPAAGRTTGRCAAATGCQPLRHPTPGRCAAGLAGPGRGQRPGRPGAGVRLAAVETVDPSGNLIRYRYERDPADPAGYDQLYLAEISYADYGDPANPSFLVRVAFAYEHAPGRVLRPSRRV